MAKKKINPLEKVAKRFNITTREVRDIVTAVSTLGRATTDKTIRGKSERFVDRDVSAKRRDRYVGSIEKREVKTRAAQNLAKQVGEVYTAVTKGKSGTKSAQLKSKKDSTGRTRQVDYQLETKRKQGGKK